VQSLADVSWRLNRVASIETTLVSLAAEPQDILALFERQSKVQANLSLHTQRLSRQFERTVTQLRELQSDRQSEEEQELDELLDVMEMFEGKEEPYSPSDDGFVFSQDEIDAASQARIRKNLASEAWTYRHAAA
jgi:hypothetical protein